MLRSAPKNDLSQAAPVTPSEDARLRAAFGRYGGGMLARHKAALVVADHQQRGPGAWFLCDCRPDAALPPALVPVSMTHIRRHEDARWPQHDEACDFYREPDEQRAIVASHGASVARPFRLARRINLFTPELRHDIVACSPHGRRPALARLLARLVTDAGLQRIDADWRKPPLAEQAKAIWTAARPIHIDAGVRLTEFFCTSPARLGELKARIEAAREDRFLGTRPHGILIARVSAIAAGVLTPVAGDPIPVRGRLAVFGERSGSARLNSVQRAARAPWLVACVIGRAAAKEPVEALSAYAHPCADDDHLMLLDSDLERQTLAQLRSLQSWLGRKMDAMMTIEKPLFDVGPEPGEEADPRPVLIPDFVVGAEAQGGVRRTAIVETMGFADDAYRIHKARVHALMRAALSGAPVVEHDFHQPAGWPQRDRDAFFWRALRASLVEPDSCELRQGATPSRWLAGGSKHHAGGAILKQQ